MTVLAVAVLAQVACGLPAPQVSDAADCVVDICIFHQLSNIGRVQQNVFGLLVKC